MVNQQDKLSSNNTRPAGSAASAAQIASALLRSDPSSERRVKRANKQPQYFLPLGSMLSPNDMLLEEGWTPE